MSFPIHPADTQAMQEDQAQLFGAIFHATRSTLSLLQQSKSQTQAKPDSPKIQMNGRLVYGVMASGQLRNELTIERLRTILDALQNPIAEGIEVNRYKGKSAAIQICDAGIILFRQERDSTITVNQFQQQQESQPKQSSGMEIS